MCTICAQLRPWASDCDYAAAAAAASDVAASGPGAALDHWPLERIAEYLTEGYWGVSPARAFDVAPGGVLTYDLSALDDDGRALARAALAEWGLVTGIAFHEAAGGWAPAAVLREQGDAGASVAGAAQTVVGAAFEGTIDGAGDRDWVRVTIANGQNVTISLEGIGANGLAAPDATIRTSGGHDYGFAWERDGGAISITIQASGGPATLLVDAGGDGGATGDYRLTARDAEAAGGGAAIRFDGEGSGAYATFSSSGGVIRGAEVHVSRDWLDAYGAAVGGYGFQTYLHEIGHALGLGHAGPYNGAAAFSRDALYANDSWLTTVMSYFDQHENPHLDLARAFVVTPMAADIEAIRLLYGHAAVREGDTNYGERSTAGGALDVVAGAGRALAFTIVDTGGHDHLDLRDQAADQRVDLREEAVSDVFGHRGNMVIARGTVIEDATLGRGDDAFVGNDAANSVWGRDGDDDLDGGAGRDAVWGGKGHDVVRGGAGHDRVHGNNGDDLVEGGSGSDWLYGGHGDDRIWAAGEGEGGEASARDALQGGGGHDQLWGGAGRDRLWGQAGRDRLDGGAGADMIDGGAGADVLRGGAGADRFVFSGAFGDDVIEDFGADDVIDLRRVDGLGGGAGPRGLDLAQAGADVVLDAGAAGTVWIEAVALADLGHDHFWI